MSMRVCYLDWLFSSRLRGTVLRVTRRLHCYYMRRGHGRYLFFNALMFF